MAYILGFVIVVIFFLALHYTTQLTKLQKALITFFILVVIFGAISYNKYSDAQSQKLRDVVLSFEQSKTIKCNGIDVNNSNYTLSVGTYTFIGKPNSPYSKQMISASECE